MTKQELLTKISEFLDAQSIPEDNINGWSIVVASGKPEIIHVASNKLTIPAFMSPIIQYVADIEDEAERESVAYSIATYVDTMMSYVSGSDGDVYTGDLLDTEETVYN